MQREKSRRIFDALCAHLPGGVSSPVRAFSLVQTPPLIAVRAKGDTLWDADGKAYIDYCGSFGALILGHGHIGVQRAVRRQLNRGCTFGLSTPYEAALAQKIKSHMPSIEMLRFVSSGTEAVMSAIRLARAYTGRSCIVKCSGNYHGHADALLVQAGSGVTMLPRASSLGIPEQSIQHTLCIPYNDLEACRTLLQNRPDIAAVIVEPIAANMGVVPADPQFLGVLREETQRAGTLLIFDEVVTGFRTSLRGAQDMYGITPDLTCLGKIIGGGLPAAAFGGRGAIMRLLAPLGGVYQAGTLSGNPLAMCAGLQTLKELEVANFYAVLEERCAHLIGPVQDLLARRGGKATCQRVGSMFSLFFGISEARRGEDLQRLDLPLFRQLHAFLLSRGIYFPPSPYEACFVSSAHSEEHLEMTRETLLEFLSRMPDPL